MIRRRARLCSILVTITTLFLTFWANEHGTDTNADLITLETLAGRFLKSVQTIFMYTKMFVWPENLRAHYALEEGSFAIRTNSIMLVSCGVFGGICLLLVGMVIVMLSELDISVTCMPEQSIEMTESGHTQKPITRTTTTTTTTTTMTTTTTRTTTTRTTKTKTLPPCMAIAIASFLSFLVLFLPTCGIVQHGMVQMGGDRYAYLPYLGLSGVVAMVVWSWVDFLR